MRTTPQEDERCQNWLKVGMKLEAFFAAGTPMSNHERPLEIAWLCLHAKLWIETRKAEENPPPSRR
jgi:hypothetical protein